MELDPIVVYLAIALAGRKPIETADNRTTSASPKSSRTKAPTRTAQQRAPRPTRKG